MGLRFGLVAAASLLAGCAADTFATPSATDAGADAPAEAAPLSCGSSVCESFETCCIYTSSSGGQPEYQCAGSCPQPQNGNQLSSMGCTSSAECPGQVCCMQRVSGGNVSQCAAQCNVGSGQVQLCDPSAGDAGCPTAEPCSTNNIADWGLPSGFGTCGGVGVP